MQRPDRPTLRGYIAARLPTGVRQRVAARVAAWRPAYAASIVIAIGLVAHEVGYHLTGGSEFPLTVLASGHRVFVMSHGGLDALGVGALTLMVLCAIEIAGDHIRRGAS